MGILKKLTGEYFGEETRKEDMTVSRLLENCLKNGNREKFVSKFKKLDKRVNRFIVYDKDETMVGSEDTRSESWAHNDLFDSFLAKNFKKRCLSIDTLLTKPDEYGGYVDGWDKFPDSVKEVLLKIFTLFYEYPEFVSTYIAQHVTMASDKTHNVIPGDIYYGYSRYVFNHSFIEEDDIPEDRCVIPKRCFVVIVPDGLSDICENNEFQKKIHELSGELKKKFKEIGYDMFGSESIIKIANKYKFSYCMVFVKKGNAAKNSW